MRVVLTGERGVGKSTVARQIVERPAWEYPAGFVTRRVDVCPGQWALEIAAWNGSGWTTFARPNPSAPAGELPFTLDIAACERFARDHLAGIAPARPVVLDELGIVEWRSDAFVGAAAELFDRSAPLLAVIQERALDRWMDRIGRSRVDHIQRVSSANRDALAESLAGEWFSV